MFPLQIPGASALCRSTAAKEPRNGAYGPTFHKPVPAIEWMARLAAWAAEMWNRGPRSAGARMKISEDREALTSCH